MAAGPSPAEDHQRAFNRKLAMTGMRKVALSGVSPNAILHSGPEREA